MAYTQKYHIPFTDISGRNFEVRFLFDGFVGSSTALLGAESPFEYSYQTDSLLEPIKGSAATIRYVNEGGTPITEFLTEDEHDIKVVLYDATATINIWQGFIAVMDCIEDFLPVPYTVALEATDNLGLLKKLEFLNLSNVKVYDKITFTDYLNILLRKTGLELPVHIYCNLFEDGMDDRTVATNKDPFAQAKVHSRSFIKDIDTYEDCYSVLTKILDSWHCSLFQFKAEWYIVRWLELREFSNLIPGTKYAYDFTSPTAVTLPAAKNVGLTQPTYFVNANAAKEHVRGWKYAKLTYNYEQPHKLIRNDNLKELGTFIGTSTSGGIKYDSYEPLYFTENGGTGIEIVIEYDATLLNEIQRYLYVPWGQSFATEDIEVNAGDRFDISYSYRATPSDLNKFIRPYAIVRLDVSGTIYYLQHKDVYMPTFNPSNPLEWTTTFNALKLPGDFIRSDEDITEWGSFQLTAVVDDEYPVTIPSDGNLTIEFTIGVESGGSSAFLFKDFKFEYFTYLNKSTKVEGLWHKSERADNVKNNIEKTVAISDSPKNNVRGVMFLTNGTTKTQVWDFGGITDIGFTDQQAIALMQVNSQKRLRIEGELQGLYSGSHIGLATVLNLDDEPDKNMVIVSATFNVQKNTFSGSLQEVYDDTEADATLTNTFAYILNP